MSNKKVYPSFVDFKKVEEERKGKMEEVVFGSLVGYVGRDPEMRQTQTTGVSVSNTSIPVNLAGGHLDYVLGSNFSESGEDPIWIEVTAWDKTAEILKKSGVAKGDQVVVTGYLTLEEYEGKQRARLTLSRFNILRRKNAQNGAGNSGAGEQVEPLDIGDDDLPF